jgi:hypothetical protein
MTDKRWTAKLTYDDERDNRICEFEEFDELGAVVERGPNWYGLKQIVITLNHRDEGK